MEDAAALKEEGNEKFKAKEYQAAIDAYTRSLELNPNQHLCYSNRSAAYLKQGECDEKALADAEKCVELKPDWVKGYRRVCEALFALKRFEEAKTCLEKGLINVVEGDDRESLQKTMTEVPKFAFIHTLNGVWNGTVNEVLGGYEQEMEFLDGESVRVEVLGRSIIGRFWVDVTYQPHHLNIQVPIGEVPPGMPPPPPVPYIARIDDVGLHLCCPYLKMERPTEFVGPGYVLMKPGKMAVDDNSEVANLSAKDKRLRCVQELLKVIPNRKIEDVSATDSEDAAGEKLMAQVRFESAMYSIVKIYGDDIVKEVLEATKGNGSPEVLGMKEIAQLSEKLRICGILDEGGPPASPPDRPAAMGTSTGSTAAAERSAKAAAPSEELRCSDGHTLKDYVTPGSGFCDGCGKDIGPGVHVMDCRACNWYLCANCSKMRKAAPPSSEKSPSPVGAAQNHGSRKPPMSCSTAVGGIVVSAAAVAAVAFMLARKQRA